MVIVLDTTNCSAKLSDLIKNAEKEIILVSPYLQISPLLLDSLRDARSRNVSITLIYREDKTNQKSKLEELNAEILTLGNLHAKCYLNESTAIITSMNLYQYSQENNAELGVLIKKTKDEDVDVDVYDAYNALRKEVLTLYRIAKQNHTLSQSSGPSSPEFKKKAEPKKPTGSNNAIKTKKQSEGGIFNLIKDVILGPSECYCIRCHDKIEDTIEKPLCSNCYSSWARYKNENFSEKYCFNCGRPANTTYSKPLCNECFENQSY